MTADSLKAEHKAILTECLRRQQALASAPAPPAWRVWDGDPNRHDLQQQHGPRYSSGEWFSVHTDRERMRYSRALYDLEAAGLVETWARYGGRLSHVKLTAAGKRLTAKLLQAAAAVGKDGQQ